MAKCTHIKIKATDQRLGIVLQPLLSSGDVDTVQVEYELDAFWDGYAPIGIFYTDKQPENVYEQPLAAGVCVIPWEALQEEGVLYIGLRGVDGDGRVKTAAPVRYRIEKGSPRGTGETHEPTPDVYAQILAKAESAEAIAESTEAKLGDVEAIAESAETKADSAGAKADSAAAKAESAEATAQSAEAKAESAEAIAQSVRDDADAGMFTPQKGVDYFTPDELAGLAPSGYGLGTIAAETDWNNATATGFYKGATNSPNGQWFEGFVVAYSATHCVQSVWRATENLHCERVIADGTPGPWEWVNPPMTLGAEYRTTERWQGKAVYTKLVDFGALPNKTIKQLQHGAAATRVIRYAGSRSDGEAIPLWYDTYTILIDVSASSISISTSFDASAKTAAVQIWYTKD